MRRFIGKSGIVTIAASISFLFPLGVFAATPEQVTQLIVKARVLAPGTQLKVKVQGEQALISTFRNERANDKDCKIEGLLVGKTIFDGVPGITSVGMYFYNNKAPNEYKTVTIRSGDVKAFDAGTMSQDELLSSIEIKAGKVQDAATAIESKMMLSAAARRDIQIVEKADELEVSCKMPPLSEDEYKFEAFRIAQTALAFNPDNAEKRRVTVNFFDLGDRTKYKQVVISLGNLSTIQKQLASAFGSLQIQQGVAKLSARDLDVDEGPLLKERQEILSKIQGLEDKGVGVIPFVQVFQAIEAKVGAGDAAGATVDIQKLTATLTEQEKRYADAKSFKATKDGGGGGEEKGPRRMSSGGVIEPKVKGLSRWAMGFFPLLAADIIRDPKGYLADCKERFQQEAKRKAEDDPRYVSGVMWFAEVLKANNYPEDARVFEDQARSMSARLRPTRKPQ